VTIPQVRGVILTGAGDKGFAASQRRQQGAPAGFANPIQIDSALRRLDGVASLRRAKLGQDSANGGTTIQSRRRPVRDELVGRADGDVPFPGRSL
jgi:hypothetical protein